ncbi:MAG: hypothetical protein BWY06_02797 [Candidatus Latescibacteria bacterium ADurb.Bin168]|nr:MAG: hypothetical protein BWY06_02797 [Candidatus Latescibacteria bacterium ADurb.Bin168]
MIGYPVLALRISTGRLTCAAGVITGAYPVHHAYVEVCRWSTRGSTTPLTFTCNDPYAENCRNCPTRTPTVSPATSSSATCSTREACGAS